MGDHTGGLGSPAAAALAWWPIGLGTHSEGVEELELPEPSKLSRGPIGMGDHLGLGEGGLAGAIGGICVRTHATKLSAANLSRNTPMGWDGQGKTG